MKKAMSSTSSSATEEIPDVLVIPVEDPAAAEHLRHLDEDARNEVRKQVRLNSDTLDEEWETLQMLGLDT